MTSVKTSGKINIGFLKKEDVKLLKSFYRESYSPNYILLKKEFFDWYAAGNHSIIAAQYDKEVIGHLIYIPGILNYYGRSFSISWVSNWMIHPEFRHRGLGSFLIEFLLKQPADVFAANMVTKEARMLMEHYGFVYQDLHRYLAVLSRAALSLTGHPDNPRVKQRIGEVVAVPGSKQSQGIRRITRFGDGYDRFWQQSFAPKTIGSARTSEFLNWRYFQEPFLPYESYLVFDKNDQIKGLIVLRIEDIINTNLRACRLLEFFAEPEFVSDALNFLINYGHTQKCVFMDFYNLYDGFDKAFSQAGILKNDLTLSTEIPRLTQPVTHENWHINAVFFTKSDAISQEKFLDFNHWYTTSGDADQDRKNFN